MSRKHVLNAVALLLSLVSFVSGAVAGTGEPGAIVPKVEKEWALLTFLNGFNSLDSFGYKDMNEMEKIGSTDRIHVVSQWASLKTKEVHRVYVMKDSNPDVVTSPVVENLGKIDMGDYRNLIEFVRWAKKNYPAKHYFLNIWNHGNGWHFAGVPTTRDISYDDLSGNKITTEQMGVALAEISRELGHKVEIVGTDACLMAMGEVVGEMKNDISHFVGSEEVEPADGWPYDRLLAEWNAGGEKSGADVTKILTQVYYDSYKGSGQLTLSGLDLEKYDTLASAVRDLGMAIKAQPASIRRKIRGAVARTQSYTNDDYKDLGDLVDQIGMETSVRLSPEMLLSVKGAIKEFVIANKTSPTYAKSQGVAIWFPETAWQFGSYKGRYRNLAFNRDTAWIDAIQATLSAAGLL